MKKVTTLFLSMLLLVVFVNLSQAQPIKPKPKYGYAEISLEAGFSNPIGSFTDHNKLGPSFGAQFGYRITREVGLELEGLYTSFGNVDANVSKLNVIGITAGPRYYFVNQSIKSQFFLDAVVGAFIASGADVTDATTGVVTTGLSETNLGTGIGIGGTVQVADNMELFLRTRYNVIFPGKDKTVTTGGVTTTVSADSKAYVGAIGGLTFFLR